MKKILIIMLVVLGTHSMGQTLKSFTIGTKDNPARTERTTVGGVHSIIGCNTLEDGTVVRVMVIGLETIPDYDTGRFLKGFEANYGVTLNFSEKHGIYILVEDGISYYVKFTPTNYDEDELDIEVVISSDKLTKLYDLEQLKNITDDF